MRFFVSNNLMIFIILLLSLFQPITANAAETKKAGDLSLCTQATAQVEKNLNIEKHLLTTIASVESGRWNAEKKENIAWPWTINVNGKGMFFESKDEAVKAVKEFQAQGIKSIDVGCMQVNLSYHGEAFDSVEDALDPRTNVEYGADFLKRLYNTHGSWIKAATAYHSTNPEKALKYKKKIVAKFEQIKTASRVLEAKLFAANEPAKPVKVEVKAEIKAEIPPKPVSVAGRKQSINAINANEWREAKLEEWKKSKIK